MDGPVAKVPQMVEALQSRVDTLGKSRKLPANVDKATWETVKTDFETMKTEWTDASPQFASGQADAAVRKARDVKAKGDAILVRARHAHRLNHRGCVIAVDTGRNRSPNGYRCGRR